MATVVLIEGLIAVAAAVLTWNCRRSRSVIACAVLAGMGWCAFLHGFCFGVLRVEGPRAEVDPGLLAGFGLAIAIFLGLPVGLVVGVVLNSTRTRAGK